MNSFEFLQNFKQLHNLNMNLNVLIFNTFRNEFKIFHATQLKTN